MINGVVSGLGGGGGLLTLLASSGVTLFGDKLAQSMARAHRNVQGLIEDINSEKLEAHI
jgi:hypothetical protein